MTTPDSPSPQEPRDEEPRPEQQQVNPEDALRDLGQQPRVDEQGFPTAYTAVPPPLGQQQDPYHQQDPYVQQPSGYDQPPVYGQPPTAQQVPQGAPTGQPFGQPGYGQQQAPVYGQQGQQQPYGQPGYGYPPPPAPEYGSAPYGNAPYGTGQPPGMPPYAGWGQRVGAWLIDNIVAAIGISMTEAAYYDWGNGARAAAWVVLVIGVVWSVYNAYQAGQTGQSAGKRTLGIRLARYADGQPVGGAFGLLRLFMNVVFWVICFIPGVLNYLWPLWDQKSQTWSDKIASSVVVRAR